LYYIPMSGTILGIILNQRLIKLFELLQYFENKYLNDKSIVNGLYFFRAHTNHIFNFKIS